MKNIYKDEILHYISFLQHDSIMDLRSSPKYENLKEPVIQMQIEEPYKFN